MRSSRSQRAHGRTGRRLLAVCSALIATAVLGAPAQAYVERPMRLPATARAGASAASAPVAAEPASWLVGVVRRSSRSRAIAARFGARRLRFAAVYRVARARARALAAALRDVNALRYAEPNPVLRRTSALDAAPAGYARNLVVDPALPAPAPGDTTIAVVDDLVDLTHPDLAANTRQLVPGPVLGPHGTMVASAAAGALNGFGVFGIFPSAPVLSVGLPETITCADAANGISAAANAGAKIINLSFGSPADCSTLFAAVQLAFAKGSLVVAAAGNDFELGNPVIYPAAYPHVLSVAALDPTLQSSGFSSENAAVDVAAPGTDIPLATPAAFDTDGVLDGVTIGSGTSFAAPIVSGAAAWLATVRPKLSNGQIADVLRRSARDVGAPGYDPSTGFGLIQMGAALAYPTPQPDVLEPNDGISFVDGSVFQKPDPYVWTGGERRTLGGSADKIEDPIDVYRVRLPVRSRARIRLRPAFGNPDLYVYGSTATSIDDTAKVIARSRKPALKTDSVTITNRRRSTRRFYVAIGLGAATNALNASYRIEFQRVKLPR